MRILNLCEHVGARGMVCIKFVNFFHLLWTWIPMACRWIHFVTWKICLVYCVTTILTLVSIWKIVSCMEFTYNMTRLLQHSIIVATYTYANSKHLVSQEEFATLLNTFTFFCQLITLICIVVVVHMLSCHHHCEVCV